MICVYHSHDLCTGTVPFSSRFRFRNFFFNFRLRSAITNSAPRARIFSIRRFSRSRRFSSSSFSQGWKKPGF
jgi:hypothetical protein